MNLFLAAFSVRGRFRDFLSQLTLEISGHMSQFNGPIDFKFPEIFLSFYFSDFCCTILLSHCHFIIE